MVCVCTFSQGSYSAGALIANSKNWPHYSFYAKRNFDEIIFFFFNQIYTYYPSFIIFVHVFSKMYQYFSLYHWILNIFGCCLRPHIHKWMKIPNKSYDQLYRKSDLLDDDCKKKNQQFNGKFIWKTRHDSAFDDNNEKKNMRTSNRMNLNMPYSQCAK